MFDFHKFEFIYCANNDQQLQESWNSVTALSIPAGYSSSCQVIRASDGIAGGYNLAMRQSNAKYKIYLHQDVHIIARDFLHYILNLFRNYPNLGLLGVLGVKRLPPTGVWWEAEQQYGRIYSFGQIHTCQAAIGGDYESVQAIDGMIMITQYDLKWRDDLLHGWHFYDASHSLEFIKAGLTVGVPNQDDPWCEHNCASVMIPFQINQHTFVTEYKQFLSE